MTDTKLSFSDRLAIFACALGVLAGSLFALSIATWVAVHVWSSVDCTIDPQSERCVYLDKAQWERFK